MTVSHDRAFMERTVTDVVVLDGHGSAPAAGPGGYVEEERVLPARGEQSEGRGRRERGERVGAANRRSRRVAAR